MKMMAQKAQWIICPVSVEAKMYSKTPSLASRLSTFKVA